MTVKTRGRRARRVGEHHDGDESADDNNLENWRLWRRRRCWPRRGRFWRWWLRRGIWPRLGNRDVEGRRWRSLWFSIGIAGGPTRLQSYGIYEVDGVVADVGVEVGALQQFGVAQGVSGQPTSNVGVVEPESG